MGERTYPPLTQTEMREILKALGFSLDRANKHPVWERPADSKLPRKVVPLDDYAQLNKS